mmetsp:Transcript_33545/g.79093  ORF Transcript_33545/g.79093 Transcript_33545/m.79093 type:complete len:120 (-) Transcript_33545:25-384(-)
MTLSGIPLSFRLFRNAASLALRTRLLTANSEVLLPVVTTLGAVETNALTSTRHIHATSNKKESDRLRNILISPAFMCLLFVLKRGQVYRYYYLSCIGRWELDCDLREDRTKKKAEHSCR